MLVIGTRGSKLALVQANWVRAEILARSPATEVVIRVIRVTADADTESPIQAGPGLGVFVKELDDALLAGDIDLAVHSFKDVPTRIPDGIAIVAVPPREDARDAFVARSPDARLDALPSGARVGTGSLRRQAQILARRPDLVVAPIRGNVDTRLHKLERADYDAIVLACAGLRRLGLDGRITAPIPLEVMVPAPGQGALAIAARRGDDRVAPLVTGMHHGETACAVAAERAFLARVGGGCNSPVAVHAVVEGGDLRIEGLVASPDGSTVVRDAITGCADAPEIPATALAERVLAQGGAALLR